LLWLDLARILVPGVVLGLVVGKLVVRSPSHLDRLRPSFWRAAMRRMKRRHWVRLVTIALWITAASLIVSGVIGGLLQEAGVPLTGPEYPFPHLPLPILLLTVNILPIFEEWIFRGIIIDEMVRWRRSKLLAVVVSTVVFALFHLSNPGTYPAFMAPLMGAGWLLGVCYLKTGLAGAILAHNSYNSILVIILFLG
jgi:membrane protease YdiL (CAAX protease family)